MTSEPFHAEFNTVVFASEKGGVGKSTCAALFAAVVKMRGGTCELFELDNQRRLSLISGLVSKIIELPDSDKIIANDLAVVEALDPVFKSMAGKQTSRVVFVDIGANRDEAFCLAAAEVDLAAELDEAILKTVIVIPILRDLESIAGAARTLNRMRAAFPSATIVLLRLGFLGSVDETTRLADIDNYLKLESNVSIKIDLPLMRPRLIEAFEASKLSAEEFVSISQADLSEKLKIPVFVTKSLSNQFLIYLNQIEVAAKKVLRFSRGTD